MSTQIYSGLAGAEWLKIVNFTNGLQRMDEKYKQSLAQLFKEQYVVSVGYLKVPEDTTADTLKKVIGLGGHWLKTTTTVQELYFIWYDKPSETFIFWAKNCIKTNNGIKVIEKRLQKYRSIVQAQAQKKAYDRRSRSVTPPVYFHPITFAGYDDNASGSEYDNASGREDEDEA